MTCLGPVVWILRVIGLKCYHASVVVAGRDRTMVMLGNIVVRLLLAVPRPRVLVASLAYESL